MGFLAASRGDLGRAQAIFSAVRLARPAAASSYVGVAVAMANRGRPDDAVRELEAGLAAAQADGDRRDLEAFRGLMLQLGGRASESVRALRSASTHPLARAMLGEPREATSPRS